MAYPSFGEALKQVGTTSLPCKFQRFVSPRSAMPRTAQSGNLSTWNDRNFPGITVHTPSLHPVTTQLVLYIRALAMKIAFISTQSHPRSRMEKAPFS